jgi:hypothetical protein
MAVWSAGFAGSAAPLRTSGAAQLEAKGALLHPHEKLLPSMSVQVRASGTLSSAFAGPAAATAARIAHASHGALSFIIMGVKNHGIAPQVWRPGRKPQLFPQDPGSEGLRLKPLIPALPDSETGFNPSAWEND